MPIQHPRRFFVAFFLLLGVLSWWPGEVVAEPVTKAKSDVVNQPKPPVLSSEQVLRVMLQMAEVVPKRRQLTSEMVKEVTGLQLKQRLENPKRFYAAGYTTSPEWFYGFGLYPDSSPAYFPAHIFKGSFSAKSGIAAKDQSFELICQPTLGDVDRALQKMGYTRKNALNNQRISYRQGDIGILIISTFTKTAYCVRYMSIYLPDSPREGSGHE